MITVTHEFFLHNMRLITEACSLCSQTHGMVRFEVTRSPESVFIRFSDPLDYLTVIIGFSEKKFQQARKVSTNLPQANNLIALSPGFFFSFFNLRNAF